MLSVKGIYENGQVHLLEPVPFVKRANVIVTIIRELEDETQESDISLFDDLVGIIDMRSDGSIRHDQYIFEESK